nr:hypothetical protein [Microbacterium hydrocarbonoxydans]
MTADENVEETVMLTRRDRRRAVARGVSEPSAAPEDAAPEDAAPEDSDAPEGADAPSADPSPVDEATVVVDRSANVASEPVDEATVVVARPARRSRRDDDADASSDDRAVAEQSLPQPSDAEAVTDADAGAMAFAAPAEPAPAIYKPRPAPLEPSAPPIVVGAEAPTRTDDPERPSVAKQARRWGVLTLVAFGVACVASVAGLIGVGFLALG